MPLGARSLTASYELFVSYAKQELVAPLRGAMRWLGFGILAGCFLVLASFLYLLGVLRLLQSSSLPFDGSWSWIPFLLVSINAMFLVVFSLSRINQSSLNRAGRHD